MPDEVLTYDELKLRIGPAPGGAYRVFAFGPDGNAASAGFSLPFDETQLDNFVLRVGQPRRGVRAYRSSRLEEAKRFGSQLFDALITDEVRDVYLGARRVAEEHGRGLRVTLYLSETPELMEVPWEYLYERPSFLSQSIYTPVVRSLDLKTVRRPRELTLPLRILGMVSRPQGFDTLDVEEEKHKLGEALRDLQEEGMVELRWLQRATLAELDRVVSARDELHVLHYIGHGAYDKRTEDGILVLENQRGGPQDVSGEELGSLLQDERSLRLVVLNSCEGARGSHVDPFSGVAAGLVQFGIPAIVGMQFEITDQAAITFADRLYTALAQGFSVDAALAQGRRAIFAGGNDTEFGTPVLFLRAGEARLFDIQRSEVAPRPPSPVTPPAERRTEVLTVDAGGRGDHTTIAAAVAAARPGMQVAIAPGVYTEALELDKGGISIVGDGGTGRVVVRAPPGKSAVRATAPSIRIADLTLHAASENHTDASCVEITSGSVTLESCSIRGGGRAVVMIAGAVSVHLRGNRIHGSAGAGIAIQDDAVGQIEGNDIYGNARAGVAVSTGGDPTVRNNRIHDGKDAGVLVYDNGRGLFEGNNIHGNGLPGVAVRTGGDPNVRNNEIHDGEQAGVYVSENGRGTFEGNDIHRNARSGIAVSTGGDPTVRDNRIHDGKDAGVLVYENGRGLFEGNDIHRNGLPGVAVHTGGDPTVRNNQIRDGEDAGVMVYENGRGTFDGNDIHHNAKSGIDVSTGGDPTVRYNQIHDGEQAGVYVYDNGRGTFDGNDIHGNAKPGVTVRTGGDPTVRNNQIHDGEDAGVFVTENGRGTFEGNDIHRNALSGVVVSTGGDPTVRNNKIHDGEDAGVFVTENGRGTFEGNDIYGNQVQAIVTSSGGAPILRANSVRESPG